MKSCPCGPLARLFLSFLLALPAFSALADATDRHVLAAMDAFRKGDEKSLLAHRDAARNHPLEPYVEYWVLRLRLDQATPAQIAAFEERWPRTLAAEKLRLDWIKQLAKRKDWPALLAKYPELEQPDREAGCMQLQARLATGDTTTSAETLKLWQSPGDLPAPCWPLVDALVTEQKLDGDTVWNRIRRLMEQKRLEEAQLTARYLAEGPSNAQLSNAVRAPEQFLNHVPPGFAVKRTERELVMIAIARLAHSDPQAAARRWESLRDRYTAAERGYVYSQLGWQGALRHAPLAVDWYQAAENTPLTEEQIAWKARAALRAQDWKLLAATIQSMPPELAARPEWVYWLGRAWKVTGRSQDADAQFNRLAGQPHFYGNLASEELGRLIDVPPSSRANESEIAAAAADPGIQRALAFYRLDLRFEGAREWSWTLRHAGDRFLLAAAAVAKREGLFDRAISAADRTQGEHDYQMRYLAPYREYIRPAAKDTRLDESWVYGLMRQESRFVVAARSTVGARGLMQVMPTTAKWVARKLGMKHFHPKDVDDMETNVQLGTNYMRMVLESLDNQPVLASAAYNAGPGRARRWRDTRPVEGAIYIETIPFTETRDYVKKVMSNAVYYAALFEGRPQSLKARLGTIYPSSDIPTDPDMP